MNYLRFANLIIAILVEHPEFVDEIQRLWSMVTNPTPAPPVIHGAVQTALSVAKAMNTMPAETPQPEPPIEAS